MLSWSLTFLVIGLVAAVLGFSGLAGFATQIAWVLFAVFLVLFLPAVLYSSDIVLTAYETNEIAGACPLMVDPDKGFSN